MEAVNFSLNHDDGVSDKNLQEADVILMGVSRSGKTPTCLYLALQYGIRAANYPLIPDDLESVDLPRMVKPYKDKLFADYPAGTFAYHPSGTPPEFGLCAHRHLPQRSGGRAEYVQTAWHSVCEYDGQVG